MATHKFAMYREDTPYTVTLLKPAGYYTGLIGKLHVNEGALRVPLIVRWPQHALAGSVREELVSTIDRLRTTR